MRLSGHGQKGLALPGARGTNTSAIADTGNPMRVQFPFDLGAINIHAPTLCTIERNRRKRSNLSRQTRMNLRVCDWPDPEGAPVSRFRASFLREIKLLVPIEAGMPHDVGSATREPDLVLAI